MSERRQKTKRGWRSIKPKGKKVKGPNGMETFLLGLLSGLVLGILGGWFLKGGYVSIRSPGTLASPVETLEQPARPSLQDLEDRTRSAIRELNKSQMDSTGRYSVYRDRAEEYLNGSPGPTPQHEDGFLKLSEPATP